MASHAESRGPNPVPPTRMMASASLSFETCETSCWMNCASPFTITLRTRVSLAARTSSATTCPSSSSVRLLVDMTAPTRTRGTGRSVWGMGGRF